MTLPERDQGSDISTKGRRAECECCGQRVTVRGWQRWTSRMHDASILVISAEKDGAIVEQVDREGDRWGISYSDLLRGYRKES